MKWWALKQAEADSAGFVTSWRVDPDTGDGCYDAETDSIEFAAENELDMMDDDSPHFAIVNDRGEAKKWVMNSPRGKRRLWW